MKKETLEEAFDRIFDSLDYTEFDYTSFEQGAKWQQEQDKNKFSEEEVKDILTKCTWILNEDKLKWFEQFKKK